MTNFFQLAIGKQPGRSERPGCSFLFYQFTYLSVTSCKENANSLIAQMLVQILHISLVGLGVAEEDILIEFLVRHAITPKIKSDQVDFKLASINTKRRKYANEKLLRIQSP